MEAADVFKAMLSGSDVIVSEDLLRELEAPELIGKTFVVDAIRSDRTTDLYCAETGDNFDGIGIAHLSTT